MSKFTYEFINGRKTVFLEELDTSKVNFDSKPRRIKFSRDERLQYPTFVKNAIAGKTTIFSRPINSQKLFATKTTNAPLTNSEEPAYIPTHNLYLNLCRIMLDADNRIAHEETVNSRTVLSERRSLISALCLQPRPGLNN